MSISFPNGDTFENHFREMLSIIKPPERLSWSHILVVEEPSVALGRPARIERSALYTPEAYQSRFDELLGQGHGWINMSALGVLDDTLIVQIEFPSYKNNAPRDKLSVNYSRSTDMEWDLSNKIEILG